MSLEVVAIEPRTSTDFVARVMHQYRTRQPFVVFMGSETLGYPGLDVTRTIRTSDEKGWVHQSLDLCRAPIPAQISFTSGTTGRPKGIILTHLALDDTTDRLIDVMGLDEDVREYVGVPAPYSFGMGRLRAIATVGGAAYLPPRGFDVQEICQMLASSQINSLSAVPTLLRLMLRNTDEVARVGKNLRWLEIGSQPMTPDEKLEVRSLFPCARIIQHYGLTEASRSTFLAISEASRDELDTVGAAKGRCEISVNSSGRVCIRGPHVATERLTDEGVDSLVDDEGWLITNDLGSLKDGLLRYLGRADDQINCGGVKLFPQALEERLRSTLRLEDVLAVARVPDDQRGDGLLIVIERQAGLNIDDIRTAAQDILRSQGLVIGGALHLQEMDRIPRTETGKVQRSAITLWAQEAGVLDKPTPIRTVRDDNRDLAGKIGTLLGLRHIKASDSFVALGGDSLNFIQASLLVESHLGFLPDRWEQTSLEELSTLKQGGVRTALSMSAFDVVRSCAMLLALLAHSLSHTGTAVPRVLLLAVRTSTPTLILLFGAMIPLLHMPRLESEGGALAIQRSFSRSVQCYLLFALNVFATAVVVPYTWKYAIICLALAGSTPFAQILVYYAIMFMLLPLLIAAILRFRFATVFIACLLVHLAFPLMKAIPLAPRLMDQPILERLSDLFLGIGRSDEIAGPSILHSLVLVLTGYWIAAKARQNVSVENGARSFVLSQAPILGAFVIMALWSFFIPNYRVDLDGLSGMRLRNLDHPAYIFIVGGTAAIALCILLVSQWTRRVSRLFLYLGYHSLFAFGVGNVVITLWPRRVFAGLPAWVDAAFLLSVVFGMTVYYGHAMASGSRAKGLAAVVYKASSRTIALVEACSVRLSGAVVGLWRHRPFWQDGRSALRPD